VARKRKRGPVSGTQIGAYRLESQLGEVPIWITIIEASGSCGGVGNCSTFFGLSFIRTLLPLLAGKGKAFIFRHRVAIFDDRLAYPAALSD